MKSKDFAVFLSDYAKVLDESGATDGANAWRALANVFSVRPAVSVTGTCKLFPAVKGGGPDREITLIASGIPSLLRMLKPFCKKALVDDLEALERALSISSGVSLGDLLLALTPPAVPARIAAPKGQADRHVVQDHLAALENTFRDEGAFKLAYAALKADKRVKLPEAKALAKEFAGENAGTKAQALKFIWGRHNSLMESRAKEQSRDGRSAA